MVSTTVLGINAAHDAAACITVGGVPRIAVAEERLTRSKRHEGFPRQAVEYCLKYAGLTMSDIDCVVVNEYVTGDSAVDLRGMDYDGPLMVNPSHHMLHAYYAWVGSGYERPAILVLDGNGYSYGEYVRRGSPLLGPAPAFSEMEEAESTYQIVDGAMTLVRKRWGLLESAEPFYRFPSLGHVFSVASEYIFGHMQHAGKTMGLAPYGDASTFPDPIIRLHEDGLEIDTEWITKLPPRSGLPAHEDAICRDVAAKVQQELERAVVHLANELHRTTGSTDLCISGGVGLNSVTNGKLLKETPFERLFVTPASGDSGVAIGAALYGHHRVTGELPRWSAFTDYLGYRYGAEDVEQALAGRRDFVTVERLDDPAAAAVADIVAGRFVGWFEGGSEFGPRALGHRSILCDPRPADMRDRLNAHVKFREPFRPYAASVLTEFLGDYFDIGTEDDYMMSVAPVRADRLTAIKSVCHVDDTCRIQTVPAGHPGGYRRLIETFHRQTGVPLVLNTSFNVRGEPIVETPDDALRCFLACNLDVLYLENYRVEKHPADPALVPRLNDGITLRAELANQDNAPAAPRYTCVTRTGFRLEVNAGEFALLSAIGPDRTAAELAGERDEAATVAVLHGLQRRGIISFARTAGAHDA